MAAGKDQVQGKGEAQRTEGGVEISQGALLTTVLASGTAPDCLA